jgi:integrase
MTRPTPAAPRRNRHRNIGLMPEQITALLAALPTYRDDAMVRLGLSVGLRVSELITITQADIDWQLGKIKIWDEKKDRMREVTPDSPTLAVLRRYVASIGAQRELWPITAKTVNRIVAAASRQALGRVITWHSLRTSYVSTCRANDVPLEIVQANTGDSRSTILRYYSRIPDQVVRQIIDAHPVIPS